MSKQPETVIVTAPEGRATPLHRTTGRLPGGGLLIVNPGEEVEVPHDSYVRRRIARGDLVIVNKAAKSAIVTAEDGESKES